jgi:hypothetical protein
LYPAKRSQDTSVGIGSRLRIGRPNSRGSISSRDKAFSLVHHVKTGSGSGLPLVKRVPRAGSTEKKRKELEPEHWPPS